MNSLKNIIFLISILIGFVASATHNRSGEITYRHISGYTYEVTVTTCTKTSSEADRNELEIYWGDGTRDTIPRISSDFFTTFDAQKNVYQSLHTYAGPATYTISMEDPNRNAGVINITSSVDKPFCLQTQLVISPFLGNSNNSLILEDCPCPELACVNQKWCYNTGAYDPDGDSLSYAIIPCKGEGCLSMDIPSVYQYPHDIGGGTLIIDPVTGTLCWENPLFQGEYNIAIKISEFRQGVFIGSVIRDMQITVSTCNNDAPVIVNILDTCIEANTTLNQLMQATDINNDFVEFTATGEPLNDPLNPAVFNPINTNGNSTGTFNWTPDCDDIRPVPYHVVFTAEDNDLPVPLKDIFVWRIRVKVPPVENLNVVPVGNTMSLQWDLINCSNVNAYQIYRASDSVTISESCCDPGAALDLGYELVGSVSGATTTFIDNGPLAVGIRYCYVITAVVDNGTESCPEDVHCAELAFEVPIMTRVSINSTDIAIGADTVMWSRPKELNAVNFPGPYEYRLYHEEGFSGASNLVYTSPIEAVISDLDSVFVHNLINTNDTAHNYFIELYSNSILVGNSVSASSVYLVATTSDNQSELSWTSNVPWNIDSTEVFRETSAGSGVFDKIGVSYVNNFLDTGLVNGITYCYKVETHGKYNVSGIHAPLKNFSQEVCVIPQDETPPCAPVLHVEQDCELGEVILTWTNPNNSCTDDVVAYNIYYSPSAGDTPVVIDSVLLSTDTSIVLLGDTLSPGCFYVTAKDSVQYNNESDLSNVVCVEHCEPNYELPNVFSPNEDGFNDLYHPLLPFKNVDHVKFMVKNRWGNIIYTTSDPMINWDGVDTDSGKNLSEGVYFYYCEVFFDTLEGEESIFLNGFITLIRKK